MDAISKPKLPAIVQSARAAMRSLAAPSSGGKAKASGFGDIDPTAAGRASAAYNEVFRRYQGLIDALATDPSLTPEQRAAAIRSLRQQQSAEANAVHRRIMNEARAAARMRRKMQKLRR